MPLRVERTYTVWQPEETDNWTKQKLRKKQAAISNLKPKAAVQLNGAGLRARLGINPSGVFTEKSEFDSTLHSRAIGLTVHELGEGLILLRNMGTRRAKSGKLAGALTVEALALNHPLTEELTFPESVRGGESLHIDQEDQANWGSYLYPALINPSADEDAHINRLARWIAAGEPVDPALVKPIAAALELLRPPEFR